MVRTIRAECLDHLLILNRRHLTFVPRRYVAYYNQRRPHQGLGQQMPEPTTDPPTSPAAPEQVQRHPVLGGLIRDYMVAA